ncbi:MAG: hypothetical protein MJZ36_10215 [Bacteroidaceae bacterium]|nr:hypothetical protein [Bacteroidaceae bacterium]
MRQLSDTHKQYADIQVGAELTDEEARTVTFLAQGCRPLTPITDLAASKTIRYLLSAARQRAAQAEDACAQLAQTREMLKEEHVLRLDAEERLTALREDSMELRTRMKECEAQIRAYEAQCSFWMNAHTATYGMSKHDLYRIATSLMAALCRLFGLSLRHLAEYCLERTRARCSETKASLSSAILNLNLKGNVSFNASTHIENLIKNDGKVEL